MHQAKRSADLSSPPSAPAWLLLFASVLSGCLWFLAVPDFDLWPLAWFAMVPTLWAMENAGSRRRAVLLAWFAGTVGNVGGFYWMAGLLERFGGLPTPVAILGLVGLAAYQGLIFLLFAWAVLVIRDASRKQFGRPLPMVLVAPLAIAGFETLWPVVFPYGVSVTQAWVTPVIQVADLTGAVGVSALLLAVNGALYDGLLERPRRLAPVGAGFAVVAIALTYGALRMNDIDAQREAAEKLDIGLIQGNIPFNEKGDLSLAESQLRDLQHQSAAAEADGADLIVWAETAYPYLLSRDVDSDLDENSPARIRRGFSAPLFFGARTEDLSQPGILPYNSALLLDEDGRIAGLFDKIFLLVFGEYVPLADTFSFIRELLPPGAGHLSRGSDIVVFPFEHEGESYRLGPMICYEDILPDFGRALAEHRPHLLVNITNDAWFGDTAEPWQHLALSVFRSVELRTDMVRAVNTGVSAFIDANGRVYAETDVVDPSERPVGPDRLVGEVALMEAGHTAYAAIGDVFGWGCFGVTALGWIGWPLLLRRRRPSSVDRRP